MVLFLTPLFTVNERKSNIKERRKKRKEVRERREEKNPICGGEVSQCEAASQVLEADGQTCS